MFYPPPDLAVAVRRRIAAAPEPYGLDRLLRRLQLHLGLLSEIALRPAFRTSAAMGLAILFSVFLLNNGLGVFAPVADVPTGTNPRGIAVAYDGLRVTLRQGTVTVH